MLEAVRSGDEAAFAALAERYRRPLLAHCYRMLGSIMMPKTTVQETLLRAWRGREGFEGRSLFRTWLYRIATNVCLNALERAPRRVLPQDVAPPVKPGFNRATLRDTPAWGALEMLVAASPVPITCSRPGRVDETDPHGMTRPSREGYPSSRFFAALQHLPPRSARRSLTWREVLGWSAKENGSSLLEMTVAIRQRRAAAGARDDARATTGRGQGSAPPATTAVTADEHDVLNRFMQAWERADVEALTALLREDARWSMPPAPLWFDGRDAIAGLLSLFPPSRLGDIRMVATTANRQPSAIGYLRAHGQPEFRLTGLNVLRIENGEIAEITTFRRPSCLPSTSRPPSDRRSLAVDR